jgi:hypothetical protein
LSKERRAELADMLADESTFEAAYPALADYLRTTARMPRASDDRLRSAEDEFDLRLLHFMTGGAGGASENPYWDIVAPAVAPSPDHQREVNAGSTTPSARLRFAQGLLQGAYAYAIPSLETLQWVVRAAGSRPIVEIGAGRGYWASQLSRAGATVSAYDIHPPDRPTTNTWFHSPGTASAVFHPVGGLRDLAVADMGPGPAEHVLFLCWPPSWGHPMALRALTAYERRGGDRLVYIGETDGDRSATPEFFNTLRSRWTLTDNDPSHVVWQGLHDVAQCWTRHR